jgi:hypothetical protein
MRAWFGAKVQHQGHKGFHEDHEAFQLISGVPLGCCPNFRAKLGLQSRQSQEIMLG